MNKSASIGNSNVQNALSIYSLSPHTDNKNQFSRITPVTLTMKNRLIVYELNPILTSPCPHGKQRFFDLSLTFPGRTR